MGLMDRGWIVLTSATSIEKFFVETSEGFTIYVCEQRFAVGQGSDYFKKFKGTDNLISSDPAIKKVIRKILAWTQKNVPNIADLIKKCFFAEELASPVSIIDIITALSKLFSVNEHQAVGPKVLDPIIIQEGGVSARYLAQLISLHKESILRPAIIILLQDNDFDRAKSLLSKCPNGINVKMIRNSGKCEMFKVINCGASDIDEFLSSYAMQCFSTCSCTSRKILLNEEWADNSILRYYSPLVFKIRSNLLFDEKDVVRDDISTLISDISSNVSSNSSEDKLLLSFQCMAKLFQVYCNDKGGQDLFDALSIAKELDNPLLLAHTYRYANLFTNCTLSEREDMLATGRKLFSSHGVEDHAIYCENNLLVNQFYTNYIDIRRFCEMQQEALNNVPGLVGMSLILNNTGVAHLYSGRPDDAISYFEKGLDYSRERIVQRLGLMTNIIIAKAYYMETIEEREIRVVLNYIFDNLGTERLPFLAANYVTNILAVALAQKEHLAHELVVEYPIHQVISNALTPNQLGSGSLMLQLSALAQHYSSFSSLGLDDFAFPQQHSIVTGIRSNFVQNRCLNPTIFNAWL